MMPSAVEKKSPVKRLSRSITNMQREQLQREDKELSQFSSLADKDMSRPSPEIMSRQKSRSILNYLSLSRKDTRDKFQTKPHWEFKDKLR